KNQRIFTLRGLAADPGEYPVNLSRLWGVNNASGYEPLMPRRYMKLLGIAEGGFLQPPWRIKGQDRSFDICAVRYLLAPADAFGGRAFVDDAWKYWKLASQTDSVLCYENTRARPRFYIVQEQRSVSEQEALIAIKTSALKDGEIFDPETMVLIESEQSQNQPRENATTTTTTTTATSDSAIGTRGGASVSAISLDKIADERIELSTESDFSGYLVVADQYYPGWKASLDGQTTPILRANYVQRAIALPAGKHKVVFTYEPESYRIGLLISSIALALVVLTAIIGILVALRTKETALKTN
ncbi:YfhO family protein, partial [bacterium]|nr:YfhO family protein [bacterium]